MLARRRSLALCVAILVLAATVLPATAIEPAADSRPAHAGPVQPNATSSPIEVNASPLERKRAAIATVESMDVGWRFQARQRERATDRLAGTLSAYRDGYRVSERSVFRSDRRALRALATIAWTNETAAERAADLVVAGDLEATDTSIDDAAFALARVGHRIEDGRDRRRAERAIDRARRARDRGRRALERDGWGSWRFVNHRRALVHLGVAWLHAQHALDVLDEATSPIVEIETRSDPARSNPEPLVRTLRGNVSDVRAYALGNLSVAVNGTTIRSVPLDAGPAPGRNASFAVNVTLARSIVEVSVSVTDPVPADAGSRWDRRDGRWSHFDRFGDRSGEFEFHSQSDERDRHRPRMGPPGDRSGVDTVRFDGDGLPDAFETAVVGTDPLDPDSDSPHTETDESADGVPDGGEDFDDDRLITYAEYELETDPFSNDTDRDGLPDRFEASLPSLFDPTREDTDDDGVLDGAEDFDGDGLSTVEELAVDTSVVAPDSDRDGLWDGNETGVHGTSPTDPDTDGDGLADAEELRLATDPLVADTDGDGVGDANETYTTSLTDAGSGVRISLVGRGDVARDVSVEAIDQPPDSDFLAGPVVRLRNRTSFETATVRLPIDGNATVGDPANLSVYTWSPGDDRAWHAINSTVDVANRTASANVSSFSLFTVMRSPGWEAAITDSVSPGWPRLESFEDLSGWTVEGDAEVREGAVVVSSSRAPALDPDLVVAKDGSGDFRRIQPAVDAAEPDDTILVEQGRYPEAVVVDESIDLLGRNATIDGRGFGGEDGIRFVGPIAPRISGFTITGFERGIEGRSRNVDIRLSRIVLRGNRVGIDARKSGRWTLEDVSVVANDFRGVYFAEFEGDLRVIGGELSRNGDAGLFLASLVGSVSLSDTALSENGDDGMVLFPGTRCECTLDGVEIADNGGYGLTAHDNARPVRLENVELRGNQIGLYVKGETDLELSNVDLVEHKYGIYSGITTGGIELADVTIVGDPHERAMGIQAGASAADWRLERVTIRDNRYVGIRSAEATGDWNLVDVSLSENGVNVLATEATGAWDLTDVRVEDARHDGIEAPNTAGRWTLTDVLLSDNGRDGLRLDGSTAIWSVEAGRIASNGRYGVGATEATGPVSIHRARFDGNGQAGVAAPNATPPIDASENWWGRATGPGADQSVGNVIIDPFCEAHDCQAGSDDGEPEPQARAPAGRQRFSPDDNPPRGSTDVEPVDRSVVRRATTLPANADSITVAVRMKGIAGDRSTARVTVVGDAEETVVGEAASSTDTYGTETANLSHFAGQTVTLVAETVGEAELSVDWIDFVVDTDGDGLRDAVERADLGMPTGPTPGAPLTSLDPTNPDSDGDGLPDGEELTGVTVERESTGLGDALSVRADAAAADPTTTNSDGGGLNDSEELAAGSDPFVLETLVVGYTIPTMTHGPGDTLGDRQPMTVGEANGIQAVGGPDSDVIAWPSRQYVDPLICFKELTDGPGCSGEWLRGVDPDVDNLYVSVPFVIYAQSNEDFGDVPYRLTPGPNAVKEVNTSGTIGRGETRRGYIVYEFREHQVGNEFHRRIFRSVGELTLDTDHSGTVFDRPEPSTVGRRYTVSTSTTLQRTEQMLQDTQFVLEQGINVAFAAEAGYLIAIETGSSLHGALAFLYHLAKSQRSTPPTSIEDIAEEVSYRGIAAFEEKVRETQGAIDEDVFGNGTVRSVGPTIIRQN